MAELVRSENDLPTIRILLGGTVDSRSDVIFEIVRGKGESYEITRCTTADLCLPDGPTPDLRMANDCRLPEGVLRVLEMAVNQPGFAAESTSNAIWLELPSPRGYLHLVPWERLLVTLKRPVLRLPYHTLRPQASANTLEIALCASSPSAKAGFDTAAVLADMTNAWLYHAGHAVTLHLFTDVIGYKDILALAAKHAPAVVVHDPHIADAYDEPAPTTRLSDSTMLTSPWLRWIQAELSGRAVDVVHFVTHGYLSGQRGAIAFAGSPTHNVDTRLARFVGAAEMSSFVGQVGAWALVLGGPPHNFSPVGLREFADTSALQRPGATIVHELDLDPHGKDFSEIVEMVFAGWPSVLHPMPGVTCWVHPGFVEYPPGEQDALHLTQSGHSSLILEATENVMASGVTPAWVAASTRFLETQQSEWLPDSPDQVVHPAAASALESVSSLLERHVSKHLGGGQHL